MAQDKGIKCTSCGLRNGLYIFKNGVPFCPRCFEERFEDDWALYERKTLQVKKVDRLG